MSIRSDADPPRTTSGTRGLAQRLEVVHSLVVTGPGAERVAAAMDDGIGWAVLWLLRSAAQPAMADLGRGLAKSGTPAQHRATAESAGAEIAELTDVGHSWPVTDPHPVTRALTSFWSKLDG
ncbi:hypothetical protein [Amycolatopsis sacchari]|uniref:hypothetical protein n=1 Tax=Amycolatopsis sacchari TaxID=115433 RepID=UPI003EB9F0D5